MRDVLKQLEGMQEADWAADASQDGDEPWVGLEKLTARWLWDMDLTVPQAAMIERVSSVDHSVVEARSD